MKKKGLIRIAIVVLGIMLLANQIYNYLYIKEIGRNYSEIITRKTLELQSLQIITREASDIQHALLQVAIARQDAERWKKEVATSTAKIDSQYFILEGLVSTPKEKKSIEHIEVMYIAYKELYTTALGVLLANKADFATTSACFTKLLPAYDSYINEQEKQTAFFRERAEVFSGKLSFKTKRISSLVLFIGVLPYLIGVCFIIVAFILVVWLGNTVSWFQRQE